MTFPPNTFDKLALADARADETIPDDLFELASEQEPSYALNPGDIVAARYEVQGLLAEGGMGEVYLATDKVVDRPVALKVLPSSAPGGRKTHERFVREARVLGGLAIPGVVKVYDFGRLGDTAYLVLELLRGHSVDALIATRKKLPIDEAMWIAKSAAETLKAVHAAGYVHRDIKPSNLFVHETHDLRVVKILDFGLTRSTKANAPRLTHPGAVIGTPIYMAPATIRMQDLGPLADLYSLGVTLYEMLTGALPYEIDRSGPVVQTFRRILMDPIIPVRAHDPRIPKPIAAVVMKAISKRPREGYQSAAEMLEALEATGMAPLPRRR